MFRNILPRQIWSNDFVEALAEASRRARDWFPDAHHNRITKAEGIIIDGKIFLLSNGNAIVESSESTKQETKVYTINHGHCNCPDSQNRSPWCKHNIARGLLVRALSILEKRQTDK